MTATYSLETVVARWNLEQDMKEPVRWLSRQIRSGRIEGMKMGRSYRMTEAQILAAEKVFTSGRKPEPVADQDVPRRGLSAASLKRRIA